MVLWYDALEFLARLAGAVVVTTVVFIVAFLLLVTVSIHTSTELTRLDRLVRVLAQELALLEARLSDRDTQPPNAAGSVSDVNAGPQEDAPAEEAG